MMRHHLHMPSYFLGTFTEYPYFITKVDYFFIIHHNLINIISINPCFVIYFNNRNISKYFYCYINR